MNETMIIGVGSVLRGDDGIGMRVIDELEKAELPDNVNLQGADISGLDLLKYFPEGGRAIIVDAADMGEEPGTIKVFAPEEIEKADFNDKISTHGMALLETLTLAENIGINCDVTIVGVQPEDTGYSLELTDLIKSRIPDVVDKIKDLLKGE